MAGREFELRIKTSADTAALKAVNAELARLDVKVGSFGKNAQEALGGELPAKLEALKVKLAEMGDFAGKGEMEARLKSQVREMNQWADSAERSASRVQAGMMGAVGAVWLTAAKLALDAWVKENEEAVESVTSLFDQAVSTIGEGLASMLPAGDGIKEWADSWKLALGGMTDHMETYVNDEGALLKKREEQVKKNTAALKKELDEQKKLWDAHQSAIKDQSDGLDDAATKEEKLAAADDEIAKAEVDADASLSPEEKAAKKKQIDAGASDRQARGREASRQREVSRDQTLEESALNERDQATAAVDAQKAKVGTVKKIGINDQRAADARDEAKYAEADMDRAKSFPMTHRINGQDPNKVYAEAEERKAKAEADAARYAEAAKAGRQEVGSAGTLEEEQAKLKELEKRQAGADERATGATRVAEKTREAADVDGSFDKAMEAKRRDLENVRERGAEAAVGGGGDGGVGQAAAQASSAVEQGSSQAAQDLRSMAETMERGFSTVNSAVSSLSAAVQSANQKAEQALAEAKRAQEATKTTSQKSRDFN